MSEMPSGITTTNGNWYNTTREKINKYVPGLLKTHTLEKIIQQADDWVNSANGLALVLYLALVLLQVDAVISMTLSVLLFLFWHFKGSAFVVPSLAPIVRLLNMDGFMYIISTGILIYLAMEDYLLAMWLGIVLFFLFKVGLLQLLLKMMNSKKDKKEPEIQDRVLNMLLIRYGIKEGIMPATVQKMQDDLIETANYHKTRKKK